MRIIVLASIAFVFALGGIACAQGPASYAQRNGPHGGGGPIRLEANFVAADTCQAALSWTRNAPPGQPVVSYAIPVTVVVGPNPDGCGKSRLVTQVAILGAQSTTFLIQIFFVNPAGRVLKNEVISFF